MYFLLYIDKLNWFYYFGQCGWYWGFLSWDEVEIKFLNKFDGSFLVRDSLDERYIFSLFFNMNGYVYYIRIEYYKGT